jgi:hypothetical protein
MMIRMRRSRSPERFFKPLQAAFDELAFGVDEQVGRNTVPFEAEPFGTDWQ